MDYRDLNIGDKIGNKDIAEYFLCSNQGGVRKSKKTNTIVLIAKFDNCSYKHRREGDILYFTGMGKTGNQEMKRQNKSILQAKEEGFALHLFEVYEEGTYEYAGEVELADQPVVEEQVDDKGDMRDVFMFPLKKRA